MIAIDTFTTGRKPIATIQPRNYRTTEPKINNSVKSTTPPPGTTETHNSSDATLLNHTTNSSNFQENNLTLPIQPSL
jgi:hypothetical protein